MSPWPMDELRKIAETDDLHIAPLRDDGATHGTPTWIWSVAVDDHLFVRAYHGKESRWYQAARRQRAGRITAAGMTIDVSFEAVEEGAINERVDEAYRAKYKGSPYLGSMVAGRARSATIRIAPRAEDENRIGISLTITPTTEGPPCRTDAASSPRGWGRPLRPS